MTSQDRIQSELKTIFGFDSNCIFKFNELPRHFLRESAKTITSMLSPHKIPTALKQQSKNNSVLEPMYHSWLPNLQLVSVQKSTSNELIVTLKNRQECQNMVYKATFHIENNNQNEISFVHKNRAILQLLIKHNPRFNWHDHFLQDEKIISEIINKYKEDIDEGEVVKSILFSPEYPPMMNGLVTLIGDFLVEKKLTTAFPRYYSDFTATIPQQPEFFQVGTITEHLGCTMREAWLQDALTGEIVLADLSQVVSGLTAFQHYVGGIFNDLTIDSMRCVLQKISLKIQESDGRYIYCNGNENQATPSFCKNPKVNDIFTKYQRYHHEMPYIPENWNGKLYMKPTFGRIWKFSNSKHASIEYAGKRLVSLDHQNFLSQVNLSYSRDLILFAASALPVIQAKLSDKDGLKSFILRMLQRWSTCSWQDEHQQKEKVQLQVFTEQCQFAPINNELTSKCKDEVFEKTDNTNNMKCLNAVPYLQQDHFDIFQFHHEKHETPLPTEIYQFTFK